MPIFNNFLGTGNMTKFRDLIFGENSSNIVKNPLNPENVIIGVNYKMRSKTPIIGKNAMIRIKFYYIQRCRDRKRFQNRTWCHNKRKNIDRQRRFNRY